jgi:hypothetical protein
VHQELDAHSLSRIRRHVHLLVDPRVPIFTLMEDRLQDGARSVGDVSILPVERDAVSGAIPVPEAQRTATGRDSKLLIEGAVPGWLDPAAAPARGCTVTARQR